MPNLLKLAALSALAFLSACGAMGGEPSEAQMRRALEGAFEEINANYRELGQSCERREFQDNPVMAIQCLQLCAAGGGKCELRFELTRFEKVACQKAYQEAGYVCDFVAAFETNSPMASAMNAISGAGSTGQGRFVHDDGRWRYIPNG